jgi:RHS repeat-associated protein
VFIQASAPAEAQVPNPATRIRYYHDDHLNSVAVLSDADGKPIQEQAFYPFGPLRAGNNRQPAGDPYKFTQKERDLETQADYFEARYMAPWLGRFYSVDPRFSEHREIMPPLSALAEVPSALTPIPTR